MGHSLWSPRAALPAKPRALALAPANPLFQKQSFRSSPLDPIDAELEAGSHHGSQVPRPKNDPNKVCPRKKYSSQSASPCSHSAADITMDPHTLSH